MRQVPPERSTISCRASTSQMLSLQKGSQFQSSLLGFISWRDMLDWPFCAITKICQDFLWHRSAICSFMLCTKWRSKVSVQSSLKILSYIRQRAMKTSSAAFATLPGVWVLVKGFFAHCSDIWPRSICFGFVPVEKCCLRLGGDMLVKWRLWLKESKTT